VTDVASVPGTTLAGGIAVREATPADAEAIRLVAEAAWRATYAGLVTGEAIERFLAQAYAPERVAVRVERHDVLVASRAASGAVDAFAESVIRDGHVQLVAMYARPDARGRGLGSALLAAVRERNPGLDIAADVLLGNERGEPFYAARGFEPGELLVEELAGEPIRERRWWLRADYSAG
jgi:GNAT superfamily N-acetyltransferase